MYMYNVMTHVHESYTKTGCVFFFMYAGGKEEVSDGEGKGEEEEEEEGLVTEVT